MRTAQPGDFCIRIDFNRSSPNPERVFVAMTGIIQAFKDLDKTLVRSIDNKIEPVLVLEDIEASSLKTWLRNTLLEVDDDALKNLDWKPQVGKYLVKAKYIILDFLKERTTITDASEIKDVQQQLLQAAEETHISEFPVYTPISVSDLIEAIDKLNKAPKALTEQDRVEFQSDAGNATFNMGLNFTPENIEELMTKEKLENTSTMILKVKKPDYLGTSQWEFRHDTKTIPAKIDHVDWLKQFQNRGVDVRPGDSLRATVRVEVSYGHDQSVIATHYTITHVIEVIRSDGGFQSAIEIA